MSDATPAAERPTLRPYPKIPSRGATRTGGAPTPAVREWAAAEKVHGAHFAVVCDAAGTRPAKRRELLGDDDLDAFFGVSRVWPALAVAADRCAEALRAAHRPGAAGAADSVPTVTLYGELAGGRYPHPDVPAAPGVDPVQTGVWYAPGLHWLLFDATLDTAPDTAPDAGAAGQGEPPGRLWVADRTLRTAAAAAGLLCAPPLGHGPRHRLDDLPRVFPTRVPALLGLPELDDGNLAEGYVLKPAGEWREGAAGSAGADTSASADARPLIKVKQPAFAEDRRYSGARPYLPPPQGAAGVPAWLVLQAAALLTPARAAAAVSKTGPRTPLDTIAAEIAGDAADDTAAAVGGLDDDQLRSLTAALLPGARALARFDAADRGPANRRAR
ncbi:RNA ligase family protein [Yinghuangia sp. YIM S09857]|uniref:RNA ligase family protein n=1 Tax=Yinghuangia sp. YIM S09857 TaxID=3436929 RepID=UPI003F531077